MNREAFIQIQQQNTHIFNTGVKGRRAQSCDDSLREDREDAPDLVVDSAIKMNETTLDMEENSALTQPFVGMEIDPVLDDTDGKKLSNRRLVEIFMLPKLKKNDSAEKEKQCIALLKPLLIDLSSEDASALLQKNRRLKNTFSTKWESSSRTMSKFEAKEKDWLALEFELNPNWLIPKTRSTRPVGRPTLTWDESSGSSKRRKVQEVIEATKDEPLEKIVKAAQLSAKREGESDISFILSQALSSPRSRSQIVSKIKDKTAITSYTPEEALALIIDNDMSVATYNNIREGAKTRGCNLYPPYYLVAKAKDKCRPTVKATATDTSVQISLQNLVNHTTSRVVELQEDVFSRYSDIFRSKELDLTMIYSWGFDGRTGQSQYKQTSNIEGFDDSSLFATTIIPLQLRSNESNGTVLWKNRTPQSVRYCRPLRLIFAKESKESILREKAAVDQTPSKFNQLSLPFQPIDGRLKFGISPLHAWIRALEFCLHLGYRNCDGLRCWRVEGPNKKSILEARKRDIQQKLIVELGLRVDFPRAGGSGTSNDGNTARRAFSNQETFARILDLEIWLIHDLHVILCAISTELPINPEKFGSYCRQLAQKYVKEHKWYYMPVSIHKLLIHGEQIIKESTLPLGMLSEQAGESRNRLYKFYREYHSRKINRTANLLDVFNRCIDSSDPLISNYSLNKRLKESKRLSFPSQVIEMIEVVDSESISQSQGFDILVKKSIEFPGLEEIELANELLE
ncbi:V(D)J recombination activating protein 1 [Folsomia candida]|uniref:V(D)J recombination activating protein 1 n=1 Tax=Folsomia candida TaxID=158441 RepID=A0A226DAC3_FOLCA|nr:V(D)J recombination activating protein 1 [Folsomia candida]